MRRSMSILNDHRERRISFHISIPRGIETRDLVPLHLPQSTSIPCDERFFRVPIHRDRRELHYVHPGWSCGTRNLSALSASNENHLFLIRPAVLLESRLDAGAHHPLHPLHLAPLRRRLHRHRLSPPPRFFLRFPIQPLGRRCPDIVANQSKRLHCPNLSTLQPSNLPTFLSSAFLLDRHRHHHRHPPALPLLQTHRSRGCLSPPGLGPRRMDLESNLAPSLLRRLSIQAFQRSSSVFWRFDISTFNFQLSTFNSSSPLPCWRHHRVSLRRSWRTLRHWFIRPASRSLVHHLRAGPRPRQFTRTLRLSFL